MNLLTLIMLMMMAMIIIIIIIIIIMLMLLLCACFFREFVFCEREIVCLLVCLLAELVASVWFWHVRGSVHCEFMCLNCLRNRYRIQRQPPQNTP